jgi:glycine/D-amino acid oxidase-like deaminating enzyme
MNTRRAFLKAAAAAPLLPARLRAAQEAPSAGAKPHVVVVGAGAFGGWSALHLLRGGARVTLVDSWGPGNSRASSGGDTRVIRGVYGANRVYVEMVVRSFELWADAEKRWSRPLYRQTGALWMLTGAADPYARNALPFLKDAGLPYEELSAPDARARWPQVSFEGVRWALLEKKAGYLLARRACEAVAEAFVREGGTYRQAAATPGPVAGGAMKNASLGEAGTIEADAFVFACGPWLGRVFPDVVGERVKPTRQEVFFFGTAPGDARYTEDGMPVWVDYGERLVYGIPGSERRGFKIADDTHGAAFDPTSGERLVSPEGLRFVREFVARRFPGLAQAPLLESRVCQYENSPDGHYIIDRHPAAENVWLVGGGSGHGFKMGPAVGERVARLVRGRDRVDSFFALARLSRA